MTDSTLVRQLDDALELFRRERAEFANYRRRTEEARAGEVARAPSRVIERLLPVLDDFDLALSARGPGSLPVSAPTMARALSAHFDTWLPAGAAATRDWGYDAGVVLAWLRTYPESDAWREGFTAIARKLETVLAAEGLAVIEVTPDTPFDPRVHEGLTTVRGSGFPDGTVVDVVRRGYRLGESLLRPALVRVATGPVARKRLPRKGGRAMTGVIVERVYCDDETVDGLPCGHPSACGGHAQDSSEAAWLLQMGAAFVEDLPTGPVTITPTPPTEG